MRLIKKLDMMVLSARLRVVFTSGEKKLEYLLWVGFLTDHIYNR